MKRVVPVVFVLVAALCIWLLVRPEHSGDTINVIPQTKIIAPLTSGVHASDEPSMENEKIAMDDLLSPKIALEADEQLVSIVTQDLYGDQMDEQIIAVRKPDDNDSQIFLILVEFDEYTNGFHRMEKLPSDITRPRTFSMFTRDLVGDRSTCIIASGMNTNGEQVMSIFRLRRSIQGGASGEANMQRILSINTDGSVTIQESERSAAYMQGMARGESYIISTYSRDSESANLLDQIETTYSWDPDSQRYERSGTARIAGAQIEQQMLHEILDGTAEKFEQFLSGMWIRTERTEPVSTLSCESLYFDVIRNELTFQTANNQEVYSWENPIPMRYGLYMACRNMSIPTLRRLVNIELASVDTIRLRVREDIRIKLGFGGQWEGVYKKSSSTNINAGTASSSTSLSLDGVYGDGERTLSLSSDKRFSYMSSAGVKEGIYSLFSLGDTLLVEFRPAIEDNGVRGTYTITREREAERDIRIILDPVKLGVKGMERLYEKALRFDRQARGEGL